MKLELSAWCVIAVVCASGCPNETSNSGDAADVVRDSGVKSDAGVPADVGVAPLPEVCPRGSGEVILGDINGDGVLDVADPIAIQNNVFRGARAPVCRPAADWNNEGRVEADDALRITSHLVSGTQKARTLPDQACGAASFWPEGQCAPLAFEIEAPKRVEVERFDAVVSIKSPVLAIQGWSISLFAEGCSIARASTQHTVAAEIWDDPPGLRHLGYEATQVIEGEGAISYVILSTHEDVALPIGSAGSSVVSLELVAPAPAQGSCAECRIFAGDGLRWLAGQPIDTVIAADGYAYRPELPSATVEVCAP